MLGAQCFQLPLQRFKRRLPLIDHLMQLTFKATILFELQDGGAPAKAIPIAQHAAQVIGDGGILLGALGLSFEILQARRQLSQNVIDTGQILLGRFQPVEGRGTFELVAGDARGLFKETAPLLRGQV